MVPHTMARDPRFILKQEWTVPRPGTLGIIAGKGMSLNIYMLTPDSSLPHPPPEHCSPGSPQEACYGKSDHPNDQTIQDMEIGQSDYPSEAPSEAVPLMRSEPPIRFVIAILTPEWTNKTSEESNNAR